MCTLLKFHIEGFGGKECKLIFLNLEFIFDVVIRKRFCAMISISMTIVVLWKDFKVFLDGDNVIEENVQYLNFLCIKGFKGYFNLVKMGFGN